MGTHFFVDETKAKGYVVVAVRCPDASLAVARRTVGRLVLPAQRSVHMKNESARRRGQIADAVVRLRDHGIDAFVIDTGRGPEPEIRRRQRALHALVELAANEQTAHLVLDLDETLVASDARVISRSGRELGLTSVTYSHQALASQPLLTLPDVLAWCWARNADWRRRIAPLVVRTIRV